MNPIDAYNFLVKITGTIQADRTTHLAIEKALILLKPAEAVPPVTIPSKDLETDSAGIPYSPSNPKPKEETATTPVKKG